MLCNQASFSPSFFMMSIWGNISLNVWPAESPFAGAALFRCQIDLRGN